jgi:uroporphyrin-III C-methyltransferase
MTQAGELEARRSADTEVFYMAGRQLESLAHKLREVGWAPETPALVVSRAGWPDQRISLHTVGTLGEAAREHAGQPTIVTVGAGAVAIGTAPTAAPASSARNA